MSRPSSHQAPSASEILAQDASSSSYTKAGVNVLLGNKMKSGIHRLVRPTHGPEVLGSIGGFGGLFQLNLKKRKLKNLLLVASTDGVGSKLNIAFETQRHDTIGADLVNHCVNDILVTGAEPLFFLDYLAASTLQEDLLKNILKGMVRASRAAGCALIGGETAQMPDLYRPGEYDLAGTIVGVLERQELLDGSRVRSGDLLLGLPSSGLHTNGYTLARQILFKIMGLKLSSQPAGLATTLERELLKVHRSYLPEFKTIKSSTPRALHAAAHITGGGLIDNLPRILPKNCDAFIDTHAWRIPPIFKILARGGNVPPLEMYRVFNMGIGMVLLVAKKEAALLAQQLQGRIIGEIIPGRGQVQLTASSELHGASAP